MVQIDIFFKKKIKNRARSGKRRHVGTSSIYKEHRRGWRRWRSREIGGGQEDRYAYAHKPLSSFSSLAHPVKIILERHWR